jgi:hypothetical protein
MHWPTAPAIDAAAKSCQTPAISACTQLAIAFAETVRFKSVANAASLIVFFIPYSHFLNLVELIILIIPKEIHLVQLLINADNFTYTLSLCSRLSKKHGLYFRCSHSNKSLKSHSIKKWDLVISSFDCYVLIEDTGGIMLKFLATIIFMAFIGNTYANDATGNDLKIWMKEAELLKDNRPSTVPYAGGLYDGFIWGVSRGLAFSGFYCPPLTVNNGQERDIVSKFLKDNPEKLHLQAHLLIIQALMNVFPCKTIKP